MAALEPLEDAREEDVKALILLSLALVACTGAPRYPQPGEHVCKTDWDCQEYQYCGFSQIDSYAVCRTGDR